MNPTHTNLTATNAGVSHGDSNVAPATPLAPPALLGNVLESAPLKSNLTETEQKDIGRLEAVVKGGCHVSFPACKRTIGVVGGEA